MRIGGSSPAAAWVSVKLFEHALVRAASHASQPTAKPVTAPDPVERMPAPRPLNQGRLDIRV